MTVLAIIVGALAFAVIFNGRRVGVIYRVVERELNRPPSE